MMQPGSEADAQESQQKVIDEYMSLRLKTCMLNASFANSVKNTENGHIYLKTLRERVLDELKLTAEVEFEDMTF